MTRSGVVAVINMIMWTVLLEAVVGRDVEELEPWTGEPSQCCKRNTVGCSGGNENMRNDMLMQRRGVARTLWTRGHEYSPYTGEQGLPSFLKTRTKLSSKGVE